MERAAPKHSIDSSLRLAFDVSSLYRHYRRHSGIPRFVGSLLRALEQSDHIEVIKFVNCTELGNRLDRRSLRPSVDSGDVAAVYSSGRCDGIDIRNYQFTAIHSTFYPPPDWLLESCPRWVATIHDLRPVDDPKSVEDRHIALFARMRKTIVERSTYVHCVSEFSACRVRALWQMPVERIRVIHPAVEIARGGLSHTIQSVKNLKPYVLFLSTIQPAKDVNTAIEAFLKATNDLNDKKTRLIVAGSDVRHEPNSRSWKQLVGSRRAIRFKRVSDAKRLALISAADAVLCTSRYEGFGFVPLEAIALGSPPIISTAYPCLEIMHSWPYIFQSGNVIECAIALKSILTQPSLALQATRSAVSVLSKRNWRKVATYFIKLYQDALAWK